MKHLTYLEWLDYFARKCNRCNGLGRVSLGRIDTICSCQLQARRKWRLEQVQIEPPHLKYLDWPDFTGTIRDQDVIEGHLTLASTAGSRDKAFQYCFGESYSEEALAKRPQSLCIHDRLTDGQNVVIAGKANSGKTLLGCLILKEVARASETLEKELDYRWVTFSKLLTSAKWDMSRNYEMSKNIDYAYLEQLAELDFLFIEGVGIFRGHSSPPDHIAMDDLFSARRSYRLPTVIICTQEVIKLAAIPFGQERLVSSFGREFFRTLANSRNVVMELVKDEGSS